MLATIMNLVLWNFPNFFCFYEILYAVCVNEHLQIKIHLSQVNQVFHIACTKKSCCLWMYMPVWTPVCEPYCPSIYSWFNSFAWPFSLHILCGALNQWLTKVNAATSCQGTIMLTLTYNDVFLNLNALLFLLRNGLSLKQREEWYLL